MDTTNNNYIISGGEAGKSRLNVLSQVLEPYTKVLLEMDGSLSGKSFLDVGCGSGYLTKMVARNVGESGEVTAIDFDSEMVSLAKQDANDEGITNISFHALSAYDIHWHHTFDIAYARFLLSHLETPEKALQKMVASVKPGGRVIVEDLQFSGHFCYPICKAFETYVDLFSRAAFNNHHNPEIGPQLFGMFKAAGLNEVGFDIIQPTYNTGLGKQMAYLTLDRIKGTLIKQGLADIQAIESLLAEIEVFTNDENTIMSLPRIFRVWGRKRA